MKTKINCAFEISDDALDEIEMGGAWSVHEQTGLLDGVGNVRTGDREILESSG